MSRCIRQAILIAIFGLPFVFLTVVRVGVILPFIIAFNWLYGEKEPPLLVFQEAFDPIRQFFDTVWRLK